MASISADPHVDDGTFLERAREAVGDESVELLLRLEPGDRGFDDVGILAEELEVPLAVAGGIDTVRDALAAREAGAERVVLGDAALQDPAVVTACREELGNDAVVCELRLRRTERTRSLHEACREDGVETGVDARAWAGVLADRGAAVLLCRPADGETAGALEYRELLETIARAVDAELWCVGPGALPGVPVEGP